MVAAEGEFPKGGNDPLYASEVNLLKGVHQLYTGGEHNTTVANGTDTGSYVFNFIGSQYLTSAQYAKVHILGTYGLSNATSNDVVSSVRLWAEFKESGGTYATFAGSGIVSNIAVTNAEDFTQLLNYTVLGSLTSGMKSNGMQICIFSQSVSNDVAATTSFVNIQSSQSII